MNARYDVFENMLRSTSSEITFGRLGPRRPLFVLAFPYILRRRRISVGEGQARSPATAKELRIKAIRAGGRREEGRESVQRRVSAFCVA